MKRPTLPKGFLAGGIHCGVKKKRKDLSLFFSEVACMSAKKHTTNKAKAAPVILAEEQLNKTKKEQAVIVNSGNANCMTGKRGMKDAKAMAEETAKELSVPEAGVIVSSTGVIGKFMPMKPILAGIHRLAGHLSHDGLVDAADGIMTTDRFHKISARTFETGGRKMKITGVAKGAGMIHPNMATMLCYVMTDADITQRALGKALKATNAKSFNSITVDGDMSTNDTVLLMANGLAQNRTIRYKGAGYDIFTRNLQEVMTDLAGMIVRDGEGAQKFIEIKVTGGKTERDAGKAARAIANSLLTKCAVHGGDPNWGRVASSVGSSGAEVDIGKIEIKLDGVVFFKKGRFTSPRNTSSVFKGNNALIEVDLALGKGSAEMYTCDISKKYITINSYYTT